MALFRAAVKAAPPPTPPATLLSNRATYRLVLSSLFTLALACCIHTVAAFQPIVYPATALINRRLYVYGGLTNISSSTSYSSQFASLPLDDDFDTNSLPWSYLPSNISTAMAPALQSRDGKKFIIGGSRNNIGHSPAVFFDFSSKTWSQAPDLPSSSSSNGSAVDVMQNYHRDSPGMALDWRNSMIVQFGGSNATGITNDLTLLDTNRMNWNYSGILGSVPPLYAPVTLYIPRNKLTLIMGGCDQMNETTDATNTTLLWPSHCATFDTLYTLSSESVAAASTTPPTASIITINGTLPSPRFMPCAVVLPDNNVFMMGGADPISALQDAWILNTQNWTWFKRDISSFPGGGIMGHSCQMANHDQILVIGGQNDHDFMPYPLSIIKMGSWGWSGHYFVPGFPVGVKVGLAMSVLVVLVAIIAGLLIRRKRNRMAALKKAQQDNGGAKIKKPRRSRRNSPRSRDIRDRQGHGDETTQDNDIVELEGIEYHPREGYQNYDLAELGYSDRREEDGYGDEQYNNPPNYDEGQDPLHLRSLSVDHVSSSSLNTMVGPNLLDGSSNQEHGVIVSRQEQEVGRSHVADLKD
ncbi:hypothetical protein BGZ46_010198 [Entomortierella lignicola]|nr:hypothetical protein BGZ46_010198 [Entomortierella lignicola]